MKYNNLTYGIDPTEIPLEKFPAPPNDLYVWRIDSHSISLEISENDLEKDFIYYSVCGGEIVSHCETEIATFFILISQGDPHL
jgi:hypothetical protein